MVWGFVKNLPGFSVAIGRSLCRPVSPFEWKEESRRIAAVASWYPPMSLICALVIMQAGNLLLVPVGNPKLLVLFNLICLTHLISSLIANVSLAIRSSRNLHRLGFWGTIRPRWWFEISSVLLIAGLSGLLAALIFRTYSQLIVMAASLALVGFFVTASAGYLLSLTVQRPRRGKAFECVHHYYTVFGGIFLVCIASECWPPRVFWPDGVVCTTLGAAGMVLFSSGVIAVLIQLEQNEKMSFQKNAGEISKQSSDNLGTIRHLQ